MSYSALFNDDDLNIFLCKFSSSVSFTKNNIIKDLFLQSFEHDTTENENEIFKTKTSAIYKQYNQFSSFPTTL